MRTSSKIDDVTADSERRSTGVYGALQSLSMPLRRPLSKLASWRRSGVRARAGRSEGDLLEQSELRRDEGLRGKAFGARARSAARHLDLSPALDLMSAGGQGAAGLARNVDGCTHEVACRTSTAVRRSLNAALPPGSRLLPPPDGSPSERSRSRSRRGGPQSPGEEEMLPRDASRRSGSSPS